MKKRAADELMGSVDGEGTPPTSDFKGYLDPISLLIEERLWMYVRILADGELTRYKSQLAQDNELLEIDTR